jgi:signal transduction histidine kinase
LHHYTLYTFPHLGHEHGLPHAAHFTPYVMSSVVVQAVVLLLTAYFVTTLAERVLYDERELASMAERAMAQRQLLERAMETTGTGLRVLDQNLHPFWLNEQWMKLMTNESDEQNATASQTLADGQVRVTEIAEADGSSARRVLQLTTAPLYGKSQQVAQIVELAQDVTRQREAQERLIRSSRLAAMGELAGEIAHEVNNPIGVVSAKARILLNSHREEMSEHVAAELEKMTAQADRVARVAQGLLTYCRPAHPARVSANVATAVQRAVNLVEQRARSSGVTIEQQLPPDLPSARANLDEMEQVLCNLLLNALDAMPEGGLLTIAGRVDQNLVEVTVRDTGCGMSPEVRQRVFEPFFTTKKREGTGLGLSICQGLVTACGGVIQVASEPGRGSTFIIRLPVALAEQSEGWEHA